MTTFRAAVNGYLEVRKKISAELPPMRVTPRAAEITAASDALARAVQRARPGARQGTFFTPEVGAVIRRQLEQALRSTDRGSVLALINEEETPVRQPSVHMRFPVAAVLASTPAVLLNALPPLPPELEYRFIGRILVIRDVQAALDSRLSVARAAGSLTGLLSRSHGSHRTSRAEYRTGPHPEPLHLSPDAHRLSYRPCIVTRSQSMTPPETQ